MLKYHRTYLLLIFLVSLIFILPQVFSGNMILGSDSIFHFNRFYDTAQQIKHFNFNYHISIYGFQQSGRIVNALYGPFLAYFHGFLVLLSKNWFSYQVLSNLVLYNLAGLSMYIFILKSKLSKKYAFIGAILYISSYAIQYWTIRQGFTSWGAALLPLALSLLFELNETKQVPKYLLGIYTAMMVQTHMLSSLILVLIYLPFFAQAFFQNKQKLDFLKKLCREIVHFFGLTLNIWGSYLFVLKDNVLISPRVNQLMSLNTINHNSYYWLLNPITLIPIFLLIYTYFARKWNQTDSATKTWFWVMTVFLLLTTSIIPWDYLIANENPVAQLIQFPFRFFVPVSIIAIYLSLKIISSSHLQKKQLRNVLMIILAVSVIQPTILSATAVLDWNSAEHFILNRYKVVFTGDSETIKKSFYDSDKSRALELVAKGTPDYLPQYGSPKPATDYYDDYIAKVIQNKDFTKTVSKEGLILEWQGDSNKEIEVPVIVYKNTLLELNGEKLNHGSLQLSAIGTPTVKQIPKAKNSLVLSYKMDSVEQGMIVITVLTWLLILVSGTLKFLRQR
nr:hypothetical protein [Streptococcus henryi]